MGFDRATHIHSAVGLYAVVRCLSVRLSVTLSVYCVEIAELIFKQLDWIVV